MIRWAPSKYLVYEHSVQTPKLHVDWFASAYRELRGAWATHLREDFCGTFALSREWVKRNRRNTALGLDLDPEPVAYGHCRAQEDLTPGQRKRIRALLKNVLEPTPSAADLIIACNFSFCIFKERRELVRYFRAARKSLRRKGVYILDLAGGPGMIISPHREQKSFRIGKKKVTYYWHQRSFDPIHRNGKNAIHFKLPGGSVIKNAFSYDWRLWTIPELRDALRDAGFKDTVVYWETSHKGEGTGEYARAERGDNAYSWVAYVAGLI
jgi:SAM-dependent methyltransferase